MVLDLAREHGSFGNFLADWPETDIVGLWKLLSKRGNQLGGLSAPRFLRMAGKDTFIPSDDMVAALKAQEIIDKPPTSLKDLAAVRSLQPVARGERPAAVPAVGDAGAYGQSLS